MVSRRRFVAAALATPLVLSRAVTAAAQSTLKVSDGLEYAKTTVEPFTKQHPDIKVELSSGGLRFEDGSLQSTLQSGKGPDVLLVNSGPGRVGALAKSRLISPLDDVYKQAGLDKVYLPTVMEQIRAENADGKIYEIVEGLDVFQFYYWKDIFAKHNLTPPDSWDGFFTLCKSLKDAGVKPIVLGARDNFQGGWLTGTLVQASVGREAMTKVIYDDGDFSQPNFIRAAQALKRLVDEKYIDGMEAAALNGDQAQAAFGHAQGAMMVLAQGQVINIGKNGSDLSKVGSFLLPSPNAGQAPEPTAGLATSWVLNATSKSPDAARAWLEWVASDNYLQITMKNGGFYVPARTVPDGVTLPAPIQDAAKKLAAGAGYNPSVYFPAAAKDAWYAAIQQLLTGQASPEKAFGDVQAALVKSRSGS